MNSTVVTAVFALSFGLSYSGFAADEAAPRMSDSPKAQRDRDLTLIGGSTASPEQLARAKKRDLEVLRKILHAEIAAIDAQMRAAYYDEEQLTTLRIKRDAILKRGIELEDKIERIKGETQNP